MKKSEKARNLAYRKPMAKELNFYYVCERIQEIIEKCDDVRYISESNEELIADAFDNDEEAYQFKMMFSDLEASAQKTCEDLNSSNWNIEMQEFFDMWFVCLKTGDDFGGYMGYDLYESDYIPLEYDWICENTADKFVKRMTKEQIVLSAMTCFRVYTAWQSLEQRYILLDSAMNTLLEKDVSFLKSVKEIDVAYELLMKDDNIKHIEKFERLCKSLPEEVWVQ